MVVVIGSSERAGAAWRFDDNLSRFPPEVPIDSRVTAA